MLVKVVFPLSPTPYMVAALLHHFVVFLLKEGEEGERV